MVTAIIVGSARVPKSPVESPVAPGERAAAVAVPIANKKGAPAPTTAWRQVARLSPVWEPRNLAPWRAYRCQARSTLPGWQMAGGVMGNCARHRTIDLHPKLVL